MVKWLLRHNIHATIAQMVGQTFEAYANSLVHTLVLDMNTKKVCMRVSVAPFEIMLRFKKLVAKMFPQGVAKMYSCTY